MNEKHWHLLTNYQHLMQGHEKMSARWLTEEWDKESTDFPAWLRNQVFQRNYSHLPQSPEKLAKKICLNLLSKHKNEIHLPPKI